jgi:hypothetical protein
MQIRGVRNKELSYTFYIDSFYIVRRFDYKPPLSINSGEENLPKDKKIVTDYPSLASFCDKWAKLFLEEGLCNILSVDVQLLDLRIKNLNRNTGKLGQVEYRYPLSLYGKRTGFPVLGEEVFYFDFLYKGSSVLRPLYQKGVSEDLDIRDSLNKETLESLERLFLLSYTPDSKINLQPIRITKPPNIRNEPPSRRGIKIQIPSSVQARGFKSRGVTE